MSSGEKVLEQFIERNSALESPSTFVDSSDTFVATPHPNNENENKENQQELSPDISEVRRSANLASMDDNGVCSPAERDEPSESPRCKQSEDENKENSQVSSSAHRLSRSNSKSLVDPLNEKSVRSPATPLTEASANSKPTSPTTEKDMSIADNPYFKSRADVLSSTELTSSVDEVVEYGSPISDEEVCDLVRSDTMPTTTVDSCENDLEAQETSADSRTPPPEGDGDIGTTPSDLDTDLRSHPADPSPAVPKFPDLGPKATPVYKSSAQRKLKVSSPPKRESLKTPLEINPRMLARVESLGPEMPRVQRFFLWTGIFLDFMSKISLVRELVIFGNRKDWVWFSFGLVFFLVSGVATTTYWLAHYPKPKPLDPQKFETKIFGFTKNDFKILVRRFGAVCAFFQLGTAFAAARTLRTRDIRQRKAEMDLRGMRLVDTIFLTLSIASLQVYIGIRCSSPDVQCKGREGFDVWLFLSVTSSVVSASLCYLSLDLQDKWLTDRRHLSEMACVCVYKVFELSSRVLTIGLFAATQGAWIFFVFLMHAICITGLLAYPGTGNTPSSWTKVFRTIKYSKFNGNMQLPAIDDVKLLWACLAWPPSCFVSDATDPSGQFWWRVRMCPRQPFSGLANNTALIPFPWFTMLMALESVGMLACIAADTPDYYNIYTAHAVVLTILWLVSGITWVSYVYIIAPSLEHSSCQAQSTSFSNNELPSFHIQTPCPIEACTPAHVPSSTGLYGSNQSHMRKPSSELDTDLSVLDHNKIGVEVAVAVGDAGGATNTRYNTVEPSPAVHRNNNTCAQSKILDADRQFLSVPVGFSFDFNAAQSQHSGM